MKDQKISISYIIIGTLAVILTWFIHELAHWITAEMLGYESIMRINAVYPVEGQNQTELHSNIISATGPLVTILQALIVFMVLRLRSWNKYLYPFLFTAFYMRFLAGLMNVIKANDEGRISAYLDLGLFTIPVLVGGILFLMVYKISKTYKLSWKFQLWTTIITIVGSSILILSDQFFGLRIL